MFQKDGQSKMELKLRTINKNLQEKKSKSEESSNCGGMVFGLN
jgi:hypothetical protein